MSSLVLFQKMLPVFFLQRDDLRRLINFELLILRRMSIIINPLFEWDISADKREKPTLFRIKLIDD